MQRLPIGIQSFKEIRTENYLYIDKTPQIERLLNGSDKYVFLSRPRRFGKSLLVNTLRHLFEGNKELFDGLYIQSRWKWEKYPVLLLDFNLISSSGTSEDLKKELIRTLDRIASKYGILLTVSEYTGRFEELIIELSKQTNKKVVLLVDEYDMPLTDHLLNMQKAEANREVLRAFYKVIKSLDDYIHFMFITGVSRFSKISIFSGLNNVGDITMDPAHNVIVGLTALDIEQHFGDRVDKWLAANELDREGFMERMRLWYNGYSWTGEERVYNPFSTLKLFNVGQFLNYWYDTATPKFLIDLILKNGMSPIDLEHIFMSETDLKASELHNIGLESLLFQTGYLTVKNVKQMGNAGIVYELTYPNNEVRLSLIQNMWGLMDTFRKDSAIVDAYFMRNALEAGDKDKFLNILIQMFARLPFKLRIGQEKYYQSLFYMLMTMMGLRLDLERMTSVGVLDGVLELRDKVYVIEFKYQPKGKATMEHLLESALNQIKERRYYESFLAENKRIILLAVGFLGKKEIDMRMEDLV